jgi:hypothetical protein
MLQKPRSLEEAPCTRTQDISWETLLKQGRKSQLNPLLYSSREIPFHHQEYPSTQEGAQNLEILASKRGAQLLPRSVLAGISKTYK